MNGFEDRFTDELYGGRQSGSRWPGRWPSTRDMFFDEPFSALTRLPEGHAGRGVPLHDRRKTMVFITKTCRRR